jgi:transcriptional regulator with XRE-family HTH domain
MKRRKDAGDEIRGARRNVRLAQTALANDCNVSSRTLLRWENGYSQPTKAQLADLVRALGKFDRNEAARVAAAYGTSADLLGVATGAAGSTKSREVAELALYIAADELEIRAARFRATIVAFLKTLGAQGLTCTQACEMISARSTR